MAHLDDGLGGLLTHVLDGVLVTEPVGPLHRVVEVVLPPVLLHVTQRRVDTALNTDTPGWKTVRIHTNTSLSVCQVARATGEAKCHGSKLHKEVTEIKVYWFVCLNTFKFAKSKKELFET